jgi:hypothetical protein
VKDTREPPNGIQLCREQATDTRKCLVLIVTHKWEALIAILKCREQNGTQQVPVETVILRQARLALTAILLLLGLIVFHKCRPITTLGLVSVTRSTLNIHRHRK